MLDFGEDAFTGEARWLEVAVHCPGDAFSVPLDDQRMPLSAAPYAHTLRPGGIVEGSATGPFTGQAVFNAQNDNLSPGTSAIFGVSGSGLGGYPSEEVGVRGEAADGYGVAGRSTNSIGVYGFSTNSYGVRGVTDSGSGVMGMSTSGYGVYALGDASDLQLGHGTIDSTQSPSSDLELSSNDRVDIHLDDDGNSSSQFRILNDLDAVVFAVDESGTITGSVGGGGGWSLTGNAGTNPSTNFLGTTDNQALELRVDDARALRLEPNASSPNLIGGHSSNSVSPGVEGATIGGGGRSGAPNRAEGDYATVGGGGANRAASYATVGGGWLNAATQMNAVVAGGSENEAKGNSATVGGGWNNSAGSTNATIGGGKENTTAGEATTIAGGSGNIARGDHATVPGGLFADASHYGEMAHASGSFLLPGDAQGSFYVLRGTSYDDTPTELFLDGDFASERLTVANDRVVTFDILVAARSEFGWSAGYTVQGVIENYLGVTDFVGVPVVTTLGEHVPAWDLTVVADDVNDALVIQGSGSIGETTRWVATVRTAEVAWVAVKAGQ